MCQVKSRRDSSKLQRLGRLGRDSTGTTGEMKKPPAGEIIDAGGDAIGKWEWDVTASFLAWH